MSREFFDSFGEEYDAAIRRCVPRYDEMQEMLVAYLPAGWQPAAMLDLGAGSGGLAARLAAAFPGAALTCVDHAPVQLEHCGRRLHAVAELTLVEADFRELNFEQGSFDLIASSIALHHLNHAEQARMLQTARGWLRPGGVLAYVDQFAGENDGITAQHHALWRDVAQARNVPDEEWESWMRHQAEADHHAPLSSHLRWLHDAGFREVDCLWRHQLWTLVRASVPSDGTSPPAP